VAAPAATLAQPDQAPLPALAAPSDDGQATDPAAAPALPATPRPRILLALRRAVADRDQATIATIVQAARRDAPGWDPTAELDRAPSAAGDAGDATPASWVPCPGRPPGAGARWLRVGSWRSDNGRDAAGRAARPAGRCPPASPRACRWTTLPVRRP
jgi:hypothetical protein